MAAHNWRSLRLRASDNGIPALMALPTMHAILDMIEHLGAEAAAHEASSATEAKAAITGFYDKLYKPDLSAVTINGDGYLPPPDGFGDDDVEAAFDAFLGSGVR